MTINYEMVFISPIGPIGIQCHEEKVSSLIIDYKLKKTNSKNWFYKEVSKQLEMYFKGKIFEFQIPYTLRGTEYQRKAKTSEEKHRKAKNSEEKQQKATAKRRKAKTRQEQQRKANNSKDKQQKNNEK